MSTRMRKRMTPTRNSDHGFASTSGNANKRYEVPTKRRMATGRSWNRDRTVTQYYCSRITVQKVDLPLTYDDHFTHFSMHYCWFAYFIKQATLVLISRCSLFHIFTMFRCFITYFVVSKTHM